jgi:hypothetical protein
MLRNALSKLLVIVIVHGKHACKSAGAISWKEIIWNLDHEHATFVFFYL